MKSSQESGASLFLARLKHLIGLDRAIAFTVMARFWSATAGVVTILLIARFLTPGEQGYYYTFSSLVALQVVFELGFSFVVLQLAAHERAQLSFPECGVEGNPVAHSRLASVLQTSVRWYSVAALLMLLTVLPAGFYFFMRHQHAGVQVVWKGPWCVLIIAAALIFQIDPIFSFLEGCGFISQVARMRLGQAVLGNALAWAALAIHRGLYSPALMIAGEAAMGLGFLLTTQRRKLLKDLLFYRVRDHFVGWRREIWPFQWRIAISWMCGWFIFQLFNPVIFAYQGPVAAGRMGMSLSIAGSIGAVAMAWMYTKASPFGNLVARKEIGELDRLFFRTLWQSTLLLIGGAASFFVVLLMAEHRFPKLAMRVLSPWAFGLLLLTTIMNHVVFSEALYLRAHKREPFLMLTVIGAALLGCSTLLMGKYWGVNGVAVGYFSIGVLFGLPSATYVFFKKRREWHGVSPGGSAERMEPAE